MTLPTTPPVPTAISGLPTAAAIGGAEWVPISQGGVTVKTAANTLGGVGPTGPAGPAGTVVPWCAAGGSADAITGAFTPAVTSLTDGLLLNFRASAANVTTTPTFKADATTAHTVTDLGGSALVASAIPAALSECQIRYNLANTRWELMNPANTATGVTTTGSPSNGNLAKFSGAGTITNADLSGDVTTSGGVATTLKTVNSNVGTFNNLTATINAKGLITAAANGTAEVAVIARQEFTSTGTYTPTTGMLYCIIEAWGAGGGGGGVSATNGAAGGGGGAGGYSILLATAATIGVSQSVTIGAAGTSGSNAGGTGGTGGTASVGSGPLVTATGGGGGTGSTSATGAVQGGGGGSGTVAGTSSTGAPGGAGISSTTFGNSGFGGSTSVGGGGQGLITQGGGLSAGAFGGGGGGAFSTGTHQLGGGGTPGFVAITEFCT